MTEPRIVAATSTAEIEAVRALIVEYQGALGVDLEFQGFSHEVAGLPGDYAPPGGRLLLALVDGEPAGCGAFRPLAPLDCEMKRVYVRPAFRGLALGRALAGRLIAEARAAGYRRMLLDTLPQMGAARGLYRDLGFREIAPYRHNPVPGTSFLGLDFALDPDLG